jgi:hypothetical protein
MDESQVVSEGRPTTGRSHSGAQSNCAFERSALRLLGRPLGASDYFAPAGASRPPRAAAQRER